MGNGSTPYEVEARVPLAEVVARLGRPAEARSTLHAVRPRGRAARHDAVAGADRRPPRQRPRAEPARGRSGALVALGFGNGDMARELVLFENHVQHILTKLGFRNRNQIEAWVSSGQLE